ncbi:uncharacterized protein AB675_7401 [Cyphellophora attinorum]|uniref:SnoaL-like domain-containing protein n=1 Tax=Cyphellophora attinorum TaxID=1664694 RepID=A0A0N1HGJ2_9EURO|nr:uncharacterized protein AB675_7401 [Phialophora attinorum]KPI34543.1 hypothetical protein AB675_7401 [Phialophora attinorum]
MSDKYTFENSSHGPAPFADLLSTFLRHADDPASAKYLDIFADDAQLMFGPAPAVGKEAIRIGREGSFNPDTGPIIAQQHRLGKIFFSPGANAAGASETQEVVANGSVSYWLKSGRQIDCTWVSWVTFKEQGQGGWRAVYYQVYLSTSELFDAIKEMTT